MTRMKTASKNPSGRMRKRPTFPHKTGTGNVLRLVTSAELVHRSVIDMLHNTIKISKTKVAVTCAVTVLTKEGGLYTDYVTPRRSGEGLVLARAMEIVARRIAEQD